MAGFVVPHPRATSSRTHRRTPRHPTPATWRKSTHSNPDGGDCLEVADGHPNFLPVRDSKNPTGPTLLIPTPTWTHFISALNSHTLTP